MRYWRRRRSVLPSSTRCLTRIFSARWFPDWKAEPSEEEPPRAADDSAGGPEPIFGEDTHESGAKATGAERLSARRFAPGSEDETLRRFARDLPARVPRRRGYRWRAARGGPRADARRMFREAMRNAGEFIRMRRRQRRLRQRRIVLLIDVSGSMKERTEAHLAFAHALVRAADAVEVFTIGTRLTRITRALRLKNRAQALTAASLLVADWDGGTRIGDALGAFLARSAFRVRSRAARRSSCCRTVSSAATRAPCAMQSTHLRALAWRTVWLTPLAADAGFEARTAGLVAARPILDELANGGSIDSICAHVLDLAKVRAA